MRSMQPLNSHQFPDELYLAIFSFLGQKDLLVASLVCKDWHRLSSDDSLWKPIAEKKVKVLKNWKSAYVAYAKKKYAGKAPDEYIYQQSLSSSSQEAFSCMIKSCVAILMLGASLLSPNRRPYRSPPTLPKMLAILCIVNAIWDSIESKLPI